MPDQTPAQAPTASRCPAVGPETGDPCIGVSGHDGGHPFAPPGRPIHASALAWLLDATGMPREQVWVTPVADATPTACCGDPKNLDGGAHPWVHVSETGPGDVYRCPECGAVDVD